MANTILEIVEEKKIKRFNLMGHSMGGMIVQEMTKIAGDKIDKLICFATVSEPAVFVLAGVLSTTGLPAWAGLRTQHLQL